VSRYPRSEGLSLLELLVALLLTGTLLLGLVQLVSAATASNRLQDAQAQLQENARAAVSLLSRNIRQAGFSPQPWSERYPAPALLENSADGISPRSDRISLRSWSDRNCFGNLNPDRDESGAPLHYLRESTFELNSARNLSHRCSYGPSVSELQTQIRREGVVAGVEALQALYGEDRDGDRSIDSWVRAGHWQDPSGIMGLRIGLLVRAGDAVTERRITSHQVLDQVYRAPADGRLRRVVQFAASIRGRSS
jgi:hypothetical protein